MRNLEELSSKSPLRVLDRSLDGGLGPGNLGVVCGGAGVGKSAFLVAVALDELARGRQVLHVALDQPHSRVRAYYDEIFHELVRSEGIEHAPGVWRELEQSLRIQTYVQGTWSVTALERTVTLLRERADLDPDVVLVDGYDWLSGDERELAELKRTGRSLGSVIWLSATLGQDASSIVPGRLPEPLARFSSQIDVLLDLKADAGTVHLRLLKDHENPIPKPVALDLNPTTLLLVRV